MKPEVKAWLNSTRQDSDVITDKVRDSWGTPLGHMGQYDVPLIRLSDYEALQAECEKLREAIRRLCNIYVVDDYFSGDIREEQLSRAVERAINHDRRIEDKT